MRTVREVPERLKFAPGMTIKEKLAVLKEAYEDGTLDSREECLLQGADRVFVSYRAVIDTDGGDEEVAVIFEETKFWVLAALLDITGFPWDQA